MAFGGNLTAIAKKYGQRLQGQPDSRAIPQLPAGVPTPGTTGPTGQMRFNPNVPLDTSQVEDRRMALENLPIQPGGRAGPGGDMPADRYDPLTELLRLFDMLLQAQPPRRG